MKNVLLVDTNFSSMPIHKYLVKAGFNVYVCGGNIYDYLAKSAPLYINADYSNLDIINQIIKEKHIDYIVPGCNDLSYKICSALNSGGQFFGLDSPVATETINNKEKFRTFAIKTGLPVPRVVSLAQVGDIWPLIVKPVDAYSGRGMTIVHKTEVAELSDAIANAKSFSKSQTCIMEEFVPGQLYSHTAFISAGAIVADFIVIEHGTANPFVVDTSRVVFDFAAQMLQDIRDCVLRMTTQLDLGDGLIHTQFIANESNFWLIEVTRRCPGDLYSLLIERSTGFPYAQTYAKPFVHQKIDQKFNFQTQAFVMRHTVSLPDQALFTDIQFNVPVKIEQFLPLCVTGDNVRQSPFGRIGLLFASTQTRAELDDLFVKTLRRELYSIH